MENQAKVHIEQHEYVPTHSRVLTRRGVMWLGQTCNLRCHFCYFLDRIEEKEHPEHPFMSVQKAKDLCSTVRYHYGNRSIDIQGGEPTLFKGITDLIAHCKDIGLAPTLITNAIALSSKRRLQQIKDAGIRDLLISVQGLGETYDEIVQVKGVFPKQAKAIENCVEMGVPVRFNCVLSKPALAQLVDIAQLAVDADAKVVNFLAFNPFNDQKNPGKRSVKNVPAYSEIKEPLEKAICLLEEHGVEVNVRYLPLCGLAEPFRKNIYTFRQLPYDVHEWDYASWSWTGGPSQLEAARKLAPASGMERSTRRFQEPMEFATGALRRGVQKLCGAERITPTSMTPTEELYQIHAKGRADDNNYKYAPACSQCDLKDVCDGFHGDYAEMFGTHEAVPIQIGGRVTNPKHYIQHQVKNVHQDDLEWAGDK